MSAGAQAARAGGVLLAALLVAGGAACGGAAPARSGPAPALPVEAPARIVSLVPAATEMLFAVGAGAQVVGVSSFDAWPPEVETRVRVGALLDPDVERIIGLRPQLVVIYDTQEELRQQLSRAGIACHGFRHGGLDEVWAAVRDLGRRSGHAAAGEALAGDLAARLAAISRRVAGRPRPRALLVFGREPSALRNVHASGGTGFLHELLVAAGGENVLADVARDSVAVTTELLLARAPEWIVELRPGAPLAPAAEAALRDAWRGLPAIPAVRDGRIRVLSGDEFVIPGPRLAVAAERLARALHPDAF
jgi:iron complex transport system substrate-binding protein